MIACSCKSIVMGKQSNLGPIDPQIGGFSAYSIINDFERAHVEIKNDQTRALVWHPILQKYQLGFLEQAYNATHLAKQFVKQQLQNCMFENNDEAEAKSERITNSLSDVTQQKLHDRHVELQECIDLGLNIEVLEEDQKLQDALLNVHHCNIPYYNEF